MTSEKEDIGLKVGTKEEVFWTRFKESQVKSIEDFKHNIELAEHLIKFSDDKISEEKKKADK